MREADSDCRSAPETNMRRLKNRSFAFALTLPKQWVGRIGVQESKPFRILGLNTPIKQVRKLSDDPIHKAPETWNFITINGRSGMTFRLNVNIGPPVATFETARDKVGERLIDADGNWRCGPLSGYRVDYLYLDKRHCRFAMLAGDGFHMLVNITLPPKQADDLLPAVDAVFDSIRTA